MLQVQHLNMTRQRFVFAAILGRARLRRTALGQIKGPYHLSSKNCRAAIFAANFKPAARMVALQLNAKEIGGIGLDHPVSLVLANQIRAR